MKPSAIEIQFSKKLSFNLLSVILIVFIFYIGQHILIPLLLSILLATLLLPVTQFFQRLKISRVLSITLALVGAALLIASLIYFLVNQTAAFLSDLPTIEARVEELEIGITQWIYDNFSIPIEDQENFVSDYFQTMQSSPEGGIISRTFFTLTGAISYIFFLPVYTFLILYYQELIKRFLISIFKDGHEEKVREVLKESLSISQLYITGILTEMVIVFAMNATGFFIIGVRYALFMGLLAALLNLIPYVGMILANLICMMITVVYCTDLSQVPLVAIVLVVVHLLDNSFILPFVVGSKVRINALAIIVGVLVGGALFGIFGMFLAIPGLAVLKVMFDRVEGLEPYGMILGDYKFQPVVGNKIKLAKIPKAPKPEPVEQP
jgi:predicted PurR-regulated permease PerM